MTGGSDAGGLAAQRRQRVGSVERLVRTGDARDQGGARVLALGTYQRDYPRNVLTQAGFRALGCRVDAVHAAVWERMSDRLAPVRRRSALIGLALRLLGAYASLLPRLPTKLARADLVVVGYPGHLDMLVLGPLVRLSRRRLVFDPLVTLTDTVVEDRALVAQDSVTARLVRLVDCLALRLADVVLADTEENAAYMAALARCPCSRFLVVPVGADEDVFAPDRIRDTAVDAVAQDWPAGGANATRVLFYGTFSPLQGPETIVRAAAALGPERARFVLVGHGQLAREARALAEELDARNVRFLQWVPYRELPRWIAAADVVLGIFGDTAKAARVVPNKVYQAMAMGAAIVTRDAPPVRALLEHGRSALLVPPADPVALAEAIEQLREAEYRVQLGRAARDAFLANATRAVLAARLAGALSTQGLQSAVPAFDEDAR